MSSMSTIKPLSKTRNEARVARWRAIMTMRGYKLININSKFDPAILCVPLWISALKCVARSINCDAKFDKCLQQAASVNKCENCKDLNYINCLVDFVRSDNNCVILYNYIEFKCIYLLDIYLKMVLLHLYLLLINIFNIHNIFIIQIFACTNINHKNQISEYMLAKQKTIFKINN